MRRIDPLEPRTLFSTQSDLVALINAERADPSGARAEFGLTMPAGLPDGPRPALRETAVFDAFAQSYAQWLADHSVLTHSGYGSTPLQRAQAADPAIFYDVENAGLSPTWSTDPEWIKSKVINLQKMMVQDTGHFAQIEDPGTLLVGIGIAVGTYQASPAIFYTCEMCTAIPNIPDANNDGVVDSGDFVALSRHFNTVTPIAAPALPGDYSPVTFAWQTGDFNRDGRVNALDFNELAVNFGSGAN
jgi:hypothetical protein